MIEQKIRVRALDEKIKSRIITANDLERKKKIKAMKLWHKQDVEKKRQFEKRKQQRELETQQKVGFINIFLFTNKCENPIYKYRYSIVYN